LAEGWFIKAIAGVELVFKRVIFKIRANIRTFGSYTAPPTIRFGKPPTITAAIKAGLRIYFKDRPWAYQDEILLYFYDDWDVVVNRFTIFRLLKSIGISRKMLKRIAAEKDQDNGYQFQVANYSADRRISC